MIEEVITDGVWTLLGPQTRSYGVEGNTPSRINAVGPRFVETPVGTWSGTPDAKELRQARRNGTA